MKRIKFAVVGCGHIGKKHAAIINTHPQAELTALIDIKDVPELNLQQFTAPFFSSVSSFLQSTIETDVMVIATPNGLHAMQATECLKAGKHVVIEKPMALTTKDANNIIVTANTYHKNIFVVMQNRYAVPAKWLKEVIDKKLLDEIFSVQLNCFWNRDERYYKLVNDSAKKDWHGTAALDGGVLFTQFSHFIDIFYWLFGDIKNIHSRLYSYKRLASFADSGIVTFQFGNNSIGCLNFSTAVWNKNFESSITIIAENGTVKIGGQYMDSIEYCHIKDFTMPQLNANDYKNSAANHEHVIQNVIDALNNKAAINTPANEGLKVVEIIERIYAASNSV